MVFDYLEIGEKDLSQDGLERTQASRLWAHLEQSLSDRHSAWGLEVEK